MLTSSLRAELQRVVEFAAHFSIWLRSHRGAVTMGGLLSFAVPVTFLQAQSLSCEIRRCRTSLR